MRQITNTSKFILVAIVTALIIWFGVMTARTAYNFEQTQQAKTAKIDSMFDKN